MSGLASGWPRPILGVVGDIHGTYGALDRVLRRLDAVGVDGVLLVGDLGGGRLRQRNQHDPDVRGPYLESVVEVLARVEALGVPLAWVPGNHDLSDLGRADRSGGAGLGRFSADGACLEVAGMRVAGLGGAGPARFGFCYEWTEDDVRARPELPCEVLLCHCPPARTALDITARGEHVGSEAIRERAERHRGVLVCGHIHEAPGAAQIGACLALNAGGLGSPFGQVQVGYICGLDELRYENLGTGERRVWRRGSLSRDALPAPLCQGLR